VPTRPTPSAALRWGAPVVHRIIAIWGWVTAIWRRHAVLRRVAAITGGIVVTVLVLWVLPSLLTRYPRVEGAERHTAVAATRLGIVAYLVAVGTAVTVAYTARTYRLKRADRCGQPGGHRPGRPHLRPAVHCLRGPSRPGARRRWITPVLRARPARPGRHPRPPPGVLVTPNAGQGDGQGQGADEERAGPILSGALPLVSRAFPPS
jgi:hypothetical protein